MVKDLEVSLTTMKIAPFTLIDRTAIVMEVADEVLDSQVAIVLSLCASLADEQRRWLWHDTTSH